MPGLLAVHIEPSAPPVGPGMLEELPEDDVSGGQSLAELAGEAPDPHDEGWNVVDGMDEAGNSSSQAG